MKELQIEFKGIGEMKPYAFKQIKSSDKGFIYELTNESGKVHYEVFERKINTYFDCISYPTSKAFGIWAWCIQTFDRALKKWQSIE